MKALRAAVGARRFAAIALRLLTADVIGKLRAYEAALAAMPAGRAFEVSYRELVGGPRETLLRIGAFLGLAASGSIETIAAERREGGLAPAVLEHEERLRARLLEAGLVGSGGGS
jgi:hypothetical protein